MILANCDTDSISVCKRDGTEFSKEEQDKLINELNNLFPKRIRWEPDGIFPTVIVLAAKNYILFDGKKIKLKGSSLKDAKTEKALKEFKQKIIEAMVFDTNHYQDIYNAYIKEAMNVTDINRWSSKKTISSKVLTSERTNEAKIRDAIEGSEYSEGDKAFVYFKSDGSLNLAEKFDGDYDRTRVLEKIFNTTKVFKNVIEPGTFINYKLKKNQKALEAILGYQT